MSYNVNAIVGKYIMPVTIHKPNDDDGLDFRKDYLIMYIDYILGLDADFRDFIDVTMPSFYRHRCRYHGHHRKITLKKQFDRKCIRIFYDCKPFTSTHAKCIYNKLQERYKPTSKYYMAFARISEYFY